jgi:hypothetical protein
MKGPDYRGGLISGVDLNSEAYVTVLWSCAVEYEVVICDFDATAQLDVHDQLQPVCDLLHEPTASVSQWAPMFLGMTVDR